MGQRVENELAAAKGVLAHARDLIVDAQAQPLFEVRPCVCDVAPCVSFDLARSRPGNITTSTTPGSPLGWRGTRCEADLQFNMDV